MAYPQPAAAGPPPIELVATIPMESVKGRIDHLSVSLRDHSIFVAALGNNTVEILDSQSGKHRTIPGLSEPQGIVYLADSNRLFITNGGGDRVDIVDADSLVLLAKMDGMADADNVRQDPVSKKIYVGHGKGALRILDAANGESAGDIALPGHPEAFELERAGRRIFVNVPSAHAVVVVDRMKRKVLASWDTMEVAGNFAMALDEKGRRLFVSARWPPLMLVYDIDSGKVVARVPIAGDSDDLFFDPEHKRVYVICGEGKVDVIRQETPDRYALEGAVDTASRARTGLFVAEESRLYVAAPASGKAPARLLVFRIR